MPHGFPRCLVLKDDVLSCYTCVLLAQWVSLLHFRVMCVEFPPCNPYGVHIGVDVLVVTPSDVAQGPLLEYSPSDMVWGSSDLMVLHLGVFALVQW